MDNRGYSRYRNVRSIIHSIDPLTKLIAFIALTSLVFIADDWITLGTMLGFTFVVSTLARVRIKSYFTMLFFIIPFFLMMMLFYSIAYGSIDDAFKVVSFMSIRLYEFLLIAIIYTSTTKEMDIAASIEWFITPLRIIKVPTYEIAMIIMLAIRFIPLMFEDMRMIMVAQTSRGVNVYNGRATTKIKGVSNSLLPMFVLAFKRSEDISNSMIMRGYQVGQKRSKFKKNKFFILEFLTIVVIGLLIAAIIYLGGM